MNQLTVFYDGACPLCLREIGLLRRLDRKGRIRFQDVSPPGAAEFCPIPRQALLARFHVARADGTLVNGAEAFTEAYAQIPYFVWLRPVGRFPPTRWVLNRIYDVFLMIRPGIQSLFRARTSS